MEERGRKEGEGRKDEGEESTPFEIRVRKFFEHFCAQWQNFLNIY
jgi:hypothetical protein